MVQNRLIGRRVVFFIFYRTGRFLPRFIRVHARVDGIANRRQTLLAVLNLLPACGNRTIQLRKRRFDGRISVGEP